MRFSLTNRLALERIALLIGIYEFSNNTKIKNSGSLRDAEFGLPKERKRVDPFSPFFPSDKHPCTHAGMFIPGCHELKIFSGSSHYELADDISRRLGTRVAGIALEKFADGEIKVQIKESVRGKDVYIVQSMSPPISDNIVELLLMVSTLRRASAKRVTVVIPYYAYKHHRRGSPISTNMNSRFLHSTAADIAKMLEVVGVDRIIGVDLQRPGQGHEACFFSSMIPVETVQTVSAGIEYFATQIRLRGPVTIVAANAECLKKARKFEEGLRGWLPDLPTRLIPWNASSLEIDDVDSLGEINGGEVIIVDDLIDLAAPLAKLVELMKSKGARKVYCLASHGLFTAEMEKEIDQTDITEVVIANTIPRKSEDYASAKVRRLSVAPMLAELIQAEHFKAHAYGDIESSVHSA